MNPIGSLLEERLVLDWEKVLEVLLSRMLSVPDLLGKEQKKKLYDAVRVNGRAKVTAVVDAMKEILDKLGETGKN